MTYKNLPIIMRTPFTDKAMHKKAKGNSVDVMMNKPVNPAHISCQIKMLLNDPEKPGQK